MTMPNLVPLILLLAYLMGTVNFAVLFCQQFGLPDPRNFGSKNPGSTNVLRAGNKKIALLVLIADILKGWFAVYIAWYYSTLALATWAGFLVVLGHVYPIFYRLQGGKGVATFLGVLLAIDWPFGLCMLCIWLSIAFTFHRSSLASLLTVILTVLFFFFGIKSNWLPISLTAAGIIIKQKNNIVRVIHCQANKILL